MTSQQAARLGEIAVWVCTADDLLAQARVVVYATDDLVDVDTRRAINNAANKAAIAVREMARALQAMEVERG